MAKQILFIQGAGEGAFEEDAQLAESLRRTLGPDYEVIYPAMPNEVDAPYEQWAQRIEKEIAEMSGPVILVGHSVGASVLAKYLSEIKVRKPVAGIFLLANPFWGGEGWHYEGYEKLELRNDAASKFPKNVPVFLYHARDDEVVPFEHLALYGKLFSDAAVREVEEGGHQLGGDLSAVAKDIAELLDS